MARHTALPHRRNVRVRALLAGGLVLGLGVSATMATWTDRAFVQGTFATSGFNILVQTDGATWVEAATADDAATLEFDLPLSAEMQPGSVVYAPVSLRTDDESEAARVQLQAAVAREGEPLFNAMTYTVAETTQCDSAGIVSAIETDATLAEQVHLDVAPSGSFDLAADGGDQTDLCFAVRLPRSTTDLSLAGTSTTALWEFTAESIAG